MLSKELAPGRLAGADFLGTRVVAYRRADGSPIVLEAYCAHLGADLSVGELQGDEVQCAFHHFRYTGGRSTWVPGGCAIPEAARVFRYPAVDALGMIWAFNGAEPLFEPQPARAAAEAR
jgi:phenylpropionate dioxygenase-like ring-hydroxylating dioxygenase large terminal subunit